MNTLFISDLHLNPLRPKITALFLAFLENEAPKAQALYILGDFFDSWIGDDAMDTFEYTIAAAMRKLSEQGVNIYLMPGNRDFLYSEVFAKLSSATLIPDPFLINLYGVPTLLVHGDSLCSADKVHQVFRAFVRHPLTRWIFLNTSLNFRKKIAQFLRRKSTMGNQKKSAYLMDAVQATVEADMRKFHVQRMIHGHTHQPKVHHFVLDGQDATRTVLGSWETSGHVLKCDAAKQQAIEFE